MLESVIANQHYQVIQYTLNYLK